jgi:hypothetical protein
VGVADGFPHIL